MELLDRYAASLIIRYYQRLTTSLACVGLKMAHGGVVNQSWHTHTALYYSLQRQHRAERSTRRLHVNLCTSDAVRITRIQDKIREEK